MNILKKNRVSLYLLKNLPSLYKNVIKNSSYFITNGDLMTDDLDKFTFINLLYNFNKNTKILHLSKNVIDNAKLINYESIKENIDDSGFNFNSLGILLNNDEAGFIKVERYGDDLHFLFVWNLCDNLQNLIPSVGVNTYNFKTKNFINGELDHSIFVVKILTYLMYGDITEKILTPNKKIKTHDYLTFTNNSKETIIYVDSLWRQRINASGFKVSGHFRLQPIGENRRDRKLIWIEEYQKHGYNRRATIEIVSENDNI